MQIQENISLRQYNTFGIDVYAKRFGVFTSIDELMSVDLSNNPILVLGGGSNILFTRDVDPLVLKNEIRGIKRIQEDQHHVIVSVGAGENWHKFVMQCVHEGLGGVENLSLIPGNTGASPMQNIGAYGVEIKDVFYELEAYHIYDRALVKFNASDCSFGYRESVFKNKFRGQFIITQVSFRLDKQPKLHLEYGAILKELDRMGVNEPGIQSVSQAVINIRSSKLPDPVIVGNAGSFFKNPVISRQQFALLEKEFNDIPAYAAGDNIKLAAGWLIEQCGWKGFRRNDVGCYEKQALVLVNFGNATGREVFDLSEEILQSVKNKFGVELEREVNVY